MIWQIINTIVGLWLMAAPHVLGYVGHRAQDNDQIIGPIAATFAIIAIAEVTRVVRWVNLPLGLWMLASPWILGFPTDATINSMICGAILMIFSIPRGKLDTPYAGRWKGLWTDPLPGLQTSNSP